MKKYILIIIAISFLNINSLIAQDEKPVEKPVRDPWGTTTLVDFATTRNLAQGSLEMMIHHRFGKFDNGLTDLYGIYASSNIRMGLDYGINSKLSVGFGTEKYNKMQEFRLKYSILQQTRSGSMPVDLSYYGNIVIDARDTTFFGTDYKFANRFSYFNEIIVARKFTHKISALVGLSYTHFNSVDSLTRHDIVSCHLGGRYKIWEGGTFIFEYNLPLDFNVTGNEDYDNFNEIPPAGLSAGLEFGTSTHAFQIFMSNYENIIQHTKPVCRPYSFCSGCNSYSG